MKPNYEDIGKTMLFRRVSSNVWHEGIFVGWNAGVPMAIHEGDANMHGYFECKHPEPEGRPVRNGDAGKKARVHGKDAEYRVVCILTPPTAEASAYIVVMNRETKFTEIFDESIVRVIE